jgi:amino acid transporter
VSDTQALAVSPGAPDKGLKGGALGLASSIVIGISATAPAYTVAASVGYIVLAVGVAAPAMLLLAFIPMMCVAVAFAQLNRVDPDCGTTFTWAARTFGPRTGWLGGWVMTAASVVAMAYLAGIAGSYLLLLFGATGLAASPGWVTAVGVGLIAVMTLVCWRGIEISAWVQRILLVVELIMLAIFAVVALVKVATGHAPAGHATPSLTWFNPFGVGSFGTLTAGLLVAVFVYWGWDSAVSVNEETEAPDRNPGRAAVISMALLIGIFVLATVAAQSYAGVGTHGIGLANPDTAADLLAVVGAAVLGSAWGKLLILAVLSSAIAALQTGILPTARTVLSMATAGAVPAAFGRMNRRFRTPSVATAAIGGATVVLFLGLSLLGGGKAAADAIASIGLLIAFYYALVGYTCVWHFRRVLTRSGKDLMLKGILPLVGAVTLTAVFVKSAWDMRSPDYGVTSVGGVGGVLLIGGGTIVLGALVMVGYSLARPAFFRARLAGAASTSDQPQAAAAPAPTNPAQATP